jgi:hypothetical protein
MLSATHRRMAIPTLTGRRSASARRSILGVAGIALCIVGYLLMLTSAPALADGGGGEGGCPNEQLRAETGSTGLPDCRAYEMVSPLFKGGYGVQGIEAVALNGEGVAYYSPGAFAGQPAGIGESLDADDYLARRGANGWSTVPLIPPAELAPGEIGDADLLPTLDSVLEEVRFANSEEPSKEGNRIEFALHSTAAPDIGAEWEPAGGLVLENVTKTPLRGLEYEGASPDFCHIVIENNEQVESQSQSGQPFVDTQALLPVAEGVFKPLYELNRGCGGEPAGAHMVAVNNDGEGKAISPLCPPSLGSGGGGESSQFNAIADGGSAVFFSACIANDEADYQVFVRLAGTHTLEVSKPMLPACVEVPCAGASGRAQAEFVGASDDGSRVFFTAPLAARQPPLVPGDTDSSNNLYLANIGCPEAASECGASERVVTSLVQASHDPLAGGAAEVQGVVRLAPDGSRVYFVARGVLSEEPNAQGGLPTEGADNLYVYDSVSGKIAYIADLGASERILWSGSSSAVEAQTAGAHGQFLVFSTYARLVASDTDDARDVYRYDAETGELVRVSVGEGGFDANGNQDDAPGEANADATIAPGHAGGPVKFQQELNDRAISEDGSRIVFRSGAPLSPGAVDGVYEWHKAPGESEGSVSLIAGSSAEAPIHQVVISPSGNDIFFITTQGLARQDTDGAPDIYDARVDGGFPPGSAALQQCSSDACQGPLTNPAPLLVPGSVSQAPGGNYGAPAPAVVVAAKRKAPVKCAKAKRLVHGRCVKRKTKRGRVRAGKTNGERRIKK